MVHLLVFIFPAGLNAQFELRTIPHKADTLLMQSYNEIRNINNDIFEVGSYTGNNHIEIKYRLYKPIPKRDSRKKYPLVVIFHGSGSIGTDNVSQLGLLPKLFASDRIQKKFRSYVLAPQFPTRSSDYQLDSTLQVLTSVPRPCLKTVLQLIDSIRANPNIEPRRIYVVGFSMGGSTAVNALSERPGLFAAGISIAGIAQFERRERLKKMPIWLIHGIDDTENPASSDQKFYDEMMPGSRIRFWKMEGIEHVDVFTMDLLGDALPKWLFKRHKPY